METRIVSWGNGHGIRLPRHVLEAAGLTGNETLTMTVSDRRIVLELPVRHRSLEERSAASGGCLGPYQEFDWGEPSGREMW